MFKSIKVDIQKSRFYIMIFLKVFRNRAKYNFKWPHCGSRKRFSYTKKPLTSLLASFTFHGGYKGYYSNYKCQRNIRYLCIMAECLEINILDLWQAFNYDDRKSLKLVKTFLPWISENQSMYKMFFFIEWSTV